MASPLELDRRTLRLIAIAFVLLALLSVHRLYFADEAETREVLVLQGRTMGTRYSIRIAGDGLDETLRGRIEEETTKRLDEVDRWMSNWNPDAEVSRFNAHLETSPFPVSRETAALVSFSLELAEASGGAFDISVGPLVALWGFGSGARIDGPPSEDEISDRLSHMGRHLLSAEIANAGGDSFLSKSDPETKIDLSAIAKGYGVDHVSAGLTKLGRLDHLIEIGGEVRASGERPGGGAWRVAVEAPIEEGRAIQSVVELVDRSMATSGDYRIFYDEDGKRYSHTLDPRTGRPVEDGPASASVIAASAAEADAWATTLMVLGAEEGLALADTHGVAALLLMRGPSGEIVERKSQAWKF